MTYHFTITDPEGEILGCYAEFDYRVTAKACPECGRSYASGGEPASPMEWEIEGPISCHYDNPSEGNPELPEELWPADLKRRIESNDDIYYKIEAEHGDSDGYEGLKSPAPSASTAGFCTRSSEPSGSLAIAMIPQEERLRAENRDLKLTVSALILTVGRVVVTRDVLDRAPGVSIRRTDHPGGDIVFQVEEPANG